ncbi:hypothetical protein jhhlp_005473 [Lomentospora prolificans]|uniref:Major facilitator superfamily (MFS) profile domain-containing protein n=1 Tax=Lomentospora prolificans TaxID=41688 RepID=A0A2N3N714_9PEZI|nr:hypothetical protein jhhlp_005473 [Lomentospora prolificans]
MANGGLETFSQLYVQESSPAKYRGLFFTIFQSCISFVSSTSSLVSWHVPSILAITMIFIPESPRWLIQNDRFEDGVKSAGRRAQMSKAKPLTSDAPLKLKVRLKRAQDLGTCPRIRFTIDEPLFRYVPCFYKEYWDQRLFSPGYLQVHASLSDIWPTLCTPHNRGLHLQFFQLIMAVTYNKHHGTVTRKDDRCSLFASM